MTSIKEQLKLITQIHNELSINLDNRYEVNNDNLLSYQEMNKLRELGFDNSNFEVEVMNPELAIKKDLYLKYKEKAPNYKFISDNDMIELCQKYDLVIGSNELYKEKIPNRVIQSILNFKVLDNKIIHQYKYKTQIINDKLYLINGDTKFRIYKSNNDYIIFKNNSYYLTEYNLLNNTNYIEFIKGQILNEEKDRLIKLINDEILKYNISDICDKLNIMNADESKVAYNKLDIHIKQFIIKNIRTKEYNIKKITDKFISSFIDIDLIRSKIKFIEMFINQNLIKYFDYLDYNISYYTNKIELTDLDLFNSKFYLLAPINHFDYDDNKHTLNNHCIQLNHDKFIDKINLSTIETEYNEYQKVLEIERLKNLNLDDPALLVKVDGGYLIVDLWGKEAYLEKLQNAELN